MALSNTPVFVQTPKAFAANVATANTARDGTGTIATLFTAGADGSLVTSLRAFGFGTVSAAVLILWLSLDGGSTWKLMDEKALASYTASNTTAQSGVTFVDKTNPDAAIRLPANAVLGMSITVVGSSVGVHAIGEAVDY
jgi:hypothetical protein